MDILLTVLYTFPMVPPGRFCCTQRRTSLVSDINICLRDDIVLDFEILLYAEKNFFS